MFFIKEKVIDRIIDGGLDKIDNLHEEVRLKKILKKSILDYNELVKIKNINCDLYF